LAQQNPLLAMFSTNNPFNYLQPAPNLW